MQLVVCLCAQITSRTPLVWHFIEYQRQDVSMKREYVRLLRNSNFKLNYASTRICILLVFLEVKSPQAHLLSSASQFYVSSFISTSVFFFRSELCHPLLSPWLLPPQGFRPEGEIPRRYSSNSRV